jgi:MFS family permease
MADPDLGDERTPLLAAQPNGHHDAHPDPDSPYLIPVTKTQFWFVFTPILLQYFVCMFDAYFMSTSHPVITSYFRASNAASWLSTAFMLTSTSFQPMFGRLSDTIGRRPVYLAALAGFIVTTAWCALAQSIESFITARAFCGIAAGGMMAMVGGSNNF